MAKTSIAGRAHGAKPATAKPTNAQYRPQLEGLAGVHPEVARGIQTAFDNLYSLQNRMDTIEKGAKEASNTSAAKGSGKDDNSTSSAGSTIAGINVKAPTDSSSLKNGYTIRYNSESGQFEFGT